MIDAVVLAAGRVTTILGAPTPDPAPATTPVAGLNTVPLQNWIKGNIIPVVILIVAVIVMLHARKRNNKDGMTILMGLIIGMVVLGLAVPGTADRVSTAVSSLVFG
jgi:hypothetical protein